MRIHTNRGSGTRRRAATPSRSPRPSRRCGPRS
jgi:hypothetical protein